MASNWSWIVLSLLVLLSAATASMMEDEDHGHQNLEETDLDDGGEQVLDPRLLLILPTGAGNLLNVNTTAALLALLGTAALLSALGFLIYHIVSAKIMAYKGGSGSSSGGYGNYGSYGGSSGGFGGSYGSSGGIGSFGGSSGGSYGYARSGDQIDWDSLKILDYISMMEEMWRKLDVKDPNCQKRILCELHQNEMALGPAASKIVNAFGYTRYLSFLNIPGPLKNMIEDYQEAADRGRSMNGRDCKEYFDSCEFSLKETFLKKFKSD